MVESLESVEVVAAVSGPFPLAPEVASLKPDLLIADAEIGPLLGRLPGARTVLLTMHDGAELREAARRSWADAVLCKSRLDEDLHGVIRRLFPAETTKAD